MTFKKTGTTEPGAQKAIADAKVVGHGIIATDVDGKVIATTNGHDYGKDKVEAIVKKLLKKSKK